MNTGIKMSLLATWMAASVTAALAAEPEGWKFEITPYLWAAGLEGDVTVNGQKTDFEKSAGDLMDALDIGGSLLCVVQYDRFIAWGQVDYFSLSTDEMDVEDRPAGGTLDSEMVLGELAAGYQLDGWMDGQTFDILLGTRLLSMKNDLALVDGRSASKENNLADAIVVVRPSIPMFPSKINGLRFNPTLAIGAGDSDLVYELFPQIQYQVNENIAARVGYRRVGYKFKGDEDEDNELNATLAGLIVGVGVTF